MAVILILGSSGQVGTALQDRTKNREDHTFVFVTRPEVDFEQPATLGIALDRYRPDFVINAAAYTAVDRAETETERALQINTLAVGELAELCHRNQAFLLHLSTDYVYHHLQEYPYRETDPCSPQSVYAKSKFEGEKAIQNALSNYLILRTSWVYYHSGQNFVQTMLRLGLERDQLNVVFDQIGSPTYAGDLAGAILSVIDQLIDQPERKTRDAGIYNYSNEGVCSWYDFALAIFRICDIPCNVTPILSEAYPTPAFRPPFSLMDKTLIKTTFGLEIPHWEESLRICLQTISH